MTTSQIFVYVAMAIVAGFYLRNLLLKRSILHYTAKSIGEKIKAKEKFLLLDVRTAGERSVRHIKGSIHIPFQELKERFGELEKYSDQEIICYCQSGARSLSAANTLKHRGFRVANLSGGISSWMLNE